MREESKLNENTPIIKLWMCFFLYAAIVSCLIQLVILPYIVPEWHAGNGLVESSKDAIFMHDIAVNMAQKIHNMGWSAWELRPQLQAPSGIASIFYYFTVPKLWTLIPLNAALHATASVILLRIMQFFIPHWRWALLSVLPFFLYLTPATWYAQIHRDGYSILGFYLFLYGWCLILQDDGWVHKKKLLIITMLYIIGGVFVCWIARPYLTKVLYGASIFIAFIATTSFFLKWRKNIIPPHMVFARILISWTLVLTIYPLTKLGQAEVIITSETKELERTLQALKKHRYTQQWEKTPQQWEKTPQQWEKSPQQWEKSPWMPSSIDNIFYTLSTMRIGMTTLSGKTDIDKDVLFGKSLEVISYMPRALQIVFLAPFPHHWVGEGSYASTTLMRRVVMLEMIGIYLSFIFLPYALWKWRNRLEIWIIFVSCSAIMLLYGIVFVNVGSIQRIRYGYMMATVALGVSGMIMFYQKFFKWKKELTK